MRDIFFPKTMTLRLPRILARLITSEAAKRNFKKTNGQGNENRFLNKILPNMLAYRDYKKGLLRDYLEKNVKTSIAVGMQEKILGFLSESFDYLYFDESEYECNKTINLRFDVKNEELYAELFVRLDEVGIKRSAYLRNLIHEYMNQSEYQKERICFMDEYNALNSAIAQERLCQVYIDEMPLTVSCIALEYSVNTEHWHLLYLKKDTTDRLYSVPIHKVGKTLLLNDKIDEIDSQIDERIKEIIEKGVYDKKSEFFLGSSKQ